MNLEIIKLLTEDSAKLIRACSILLKLMFTYAVAAWLFKVTYGHYTLISLTDFEAVQLFVTSGLAFICIFFALISGIFLFYLLPELTAIVFGMLEARTPGHNKIDRTERDLIWSSLRRFKIVDIRNRGRKIILMKRADMMYDITLPFTHKEGRQKAATLKHNFIYQIVHVYLVFCAYYFLLLDQKFRHWIWTIIILLIAGSMAFLYNGVSKLLDLLYRSAPQILLTIEEGRLYEKTKELFLQHGLELTDNPEKRQVYNFSFQYGAKKTGVRYLVIYGSLTANDVGSMLEFARKNEMHLLVISRNPPTKAADELLQQHTSELTYLQVNDMADLEKKLNHLISTRFNANPQMEDNQ